ncbi:MAG: arsenate reductase ArsC [Proteobacteria bacterium]|nr:arsenate reductase ArsC [Pseudomonadota bacterium]MBU1596297.1 arsenate reductase ArsC [Pseudomonadota bacterium]
MQKTRVLFVCGQNSARSQMAEALLAHLAPDDYEACSAGIEPAPINELAVAVMAERGIDISRKRTKLVAEAVAGLAAKGQTFDVVVTVCDKAAGVCPLVPGVRATERWSFDDPGAILVEGGVSREDKLARVRAVRDDIEKAILAWVEARKSAGEKA